MADLHPEFTTFHGKIKLSKSKKESLKKSRDANRERVKKHFREKLELAVPKFHGQGSYMMGTTVNPIDGEFDLDDGVYLQHLDKTNDKDWPTPATIHRWLVDATSGSTNEKPIDKNTCVRVRYAGQYHLDLPAYAELNDVYYLAIKGEQRWYESDPKALTVWFVDKVKSEGEQLRRLVRYLKAWADFQKGRKGKMVNGLILTVLASDYYVTSERDDVALAETAKAISENVETFFTVYNPVDSKEKLTDRLTDVQKKRFQNAISALATDAADAITNDDASEAADLWRRQFGDRFPRIEKEKDKNQKGKGIAKLAGLCAANKAPKPWGYK
jgi:hypothetical protein